MINKKLIPVLITLLTSGFCQVQFIDNFDRNEIEGWFFFIGDGEERLLPELHCPEPVEWSKGVAEKFEKIPVPEPVEGMG